MSHTRLLTQRVFKMRRKAVFLALRRVERIFRDGGASRTILSLVGQVRKDTGWKKKDDGSPSLPTIMDKKDGASEKKR